MFGPDHAQRSAARPASSEMSRARAGRSRAAVLATPRLVLGLRTTPLFGVLGALFMSLGLHHASTTLLVLGGASVLGALAAYQVLRLMLIARCEAHAKAHGQPDAHHAAVRQADMLLEALREDDPLAARPHTSTGQTHERLARFTAWARAEQDTAGADGDERRRSGQGLPLSQSPQ